MSREAFPGRASLSFAATDGILDIDQILSTGPWNQIDDYVQRNFMQNVLNDFNDRMALDPKRVPTDANTEGTQQEKSPRRNGVKSRNTVEMKSNDPSPVDDGDGNITSTKVTDASTNAETPRDEGSASDAKKRAGRATKGSKGEKGKNVKRPKKRGELENSSKPSPKEKETVANGPRARTCRRRTRGKRAKADLVDNQTEASTHGTETAIEEPSTPGHTNTLSPIKTSTPKREYVKSSISNSTGKEKTIDGEGKSMGTRCQGSNASETVVLADRAINNRPGFRGKGHGKYETPLRRKRPKKPILHVSERKHQQKSVKKEKRSDPNKKAKKTPRKLEKGLRDGEGKRRDRKTREHQRKAERAFEKLGLQVNSIVKRMGYLPVKARSSNRNTRDSSTPSDTSTESSCLSYSSYSSSSFSYSSSSSFCSCLCSCSYSCSCSSSYGSDDSHTTDQYTEYTLGSCSGCSCGRGRDSSFSSDSSTTE